MCARLPTSCSPRPPSRFSGATLDGVFHVELRRFPHVARAFNLTEQELQARIVLPWVRGATVELDDRRFAADRARLTVYEGPAIAPEDRGLGRGWSIVTRDGEEVTRRLIKTAERLMPRATEIKRAVLAAPGPLPLPEVVKLAGHGGRPSDRLAVAEQAVWELLHEGQATLVRAETEPVAADEWESLLLRWESWTDPTIRLLVAR